MFAAQQPISEILSADWPTLKYFAEWAKIIEDGWGKALKEVKKIGN